MNSIKKRVIMHIDFDYFYAQCEELRNTSIKDKPVVVCVYSARGNDAGAVSTANYNARRYGVKSGMPIRFAKQRLKYTNAIFLPVDHAYYDEISNKAMEIIRSFADKFEYVGDDEAYIDVSNTTNGDFDKARELALIIKNEIRRVLHLSISIGVAPNKLIAKIASGYQKPDGLTIVKPSEVNNFIADMNVDAIVGIGKKTRERLIEMNIRTIKELAKLDVYTLMNEFGRKNGIYLYNSSRGIDEEEVKEEQTITQFSKIITLKEDTNDINYMINDLNYLTNELYKIIVNNGYSFRNVGVIVVLNDLSIRSKSKSLKRISNSNEDLYNIAKTLLEDIMSDKPIVRRLGVKVSELVSSKGQDTLLKFIR